MNLLVETVVTCPHCGEPSTSWIDTSGGDLTTIEDCTVCCAPILLTIRCVPGEIEEIDARPA